jgi:hypothetical protein
MLAFGVGIILASGLDRLAQALPVLRPHAWGALRRHRTSASTYQVSIKSGTRFFGRGGVSAAIACFAASSAIPMISFIRAVIFSKIDLSVELMSPPKSGY